MANKLTKIDKSNTIGVSVNDNVIVLQKDIFSSNVNAGMIDQFIETNYPNLISRDSNKINGISVTKDEIVITLSRSFNVSQVNTLISQLENKVW